MTEPAVVVPPAIDADAAEQSRRIPRVSPRMLVTILTIAAAVLRIAWIRKQSFWLDEGGTMSFVRMSWHDMFTMVADQDLSPYLVVLRLWIHFFGDSEAATRTLSAIFSIATLPALYALTKRLSGSKRVAAVTGVLFAVNLFSIRYAQELRAYSMVLFLVVCSWLFFLRCLERPDLPNFVGYVATSVVGAYAHFFATLTFPAQWLPVLWRALRKRPAHGLIATALVTGVLLIPKFVVDAITNVGQVDWVPPLSRESFRQLFSQFSGSLNYGRSEELLTWIYVLAVVVGVFAVVGLAMKSVDAAARPWFIVLGLLLPIAAIVAVSFHKPLLVNRYLIQALPFYMIVCAVGLCSTRPRWLGDAALAAIVVLSLYQDYLYYRYYQRQDWRSATAFILDNAKPGDAVAIVVVSSRFPYDYYVSRSGSPLDAPPVIFPNWDSSCTTDGVVWAATNDPKNYEPALTRAIDAAPRRYGRVWLVLWPTDYSKVLDSSVIDRTLAAFSKRYRLDSEKSFPGQIRVMLYDRVTPAAP